MEWEPVRRGQLPTKRISADRRESPCNRVYEGLPSAVVAAPAMRCYPDLIGIGVSMLLDRLVRLLLPRQDLFFTLLDSDFP
jgi:hypothetical protein